MPKFLASFIAPMLSRPPSYQVAALCWRMGTEGPEVLAITSRGTGRWVLPKGWPKRGLTGGGTAAEEAWEEAGVVALRTTPVHVGSYRYMKKLKGGVPVPTVADVFAIQVARMADKFPEKGQRLRQWMRPEQLAELVHEEDLSALLRDLPPLVPALEGTAEVRRPHK